MEMKTYYNLSECIDRNKLTNYLDKLVSESKIAYNYEDIDTIKLVDLELEDNEITKLIETLNSYDVIVDIDREEADGYYDSDLFNDEDDYDDFGFSDNMD